MRGALKLFVALDIVLILAFAGTLSVLLSMDSQGNITQSNQNICIGMLPYLQ